MRKAVLRASVLLFSIILAASFLATQAGDIRNSTSVAKPSSDGTFLSPGFNGVTFSSVGPPRQIDEYLIGGRSGTQQSILSGGTDTLNLNIPSGWNPANLSTRVYQLSANRSFSRNPDFSDVYSQGGRDYPYYWTNSSPSLSGLRAELNTTSQDAYMVLVQGINANTGNTTSWRQLVYVNGTNPTQAKLVFSARKTPSTLGTGNDGKTNLTASVNGVRVFSSSYSSLSTSYTQQIIDITSVMPTLPATLNITMFMWFSGHVKITGNYNGYVYFDKVYLYVNCTVPPNSVALSLNSLLVSGGQYGTGNVYLHAPLATPFTFTSNTTGSTRFRCNSTISIYRVTSSDKVTFSAKQGLPLSNNVSKSCLFNDSSGWAVSSTKYTRDILNMSIPHDWTYRSVICPDGTAISGQSTGRIRQYDNDSYTWIINVNVTAIDLYRPNPYVINATSPNYLGSISTFRQVTAAWVPSDFFVNGSRIMINATIIGGSASKGSANIIFYNASDCSVWRNMSVYAVTPGDNGVASFNFAWSNSNVTKSTLMTLVRWNNGSEVGANWIPITFDLLPPEPSISGVSPNQFVRGTVSLTVSCVEAHFMNETLLVSGSAVYSWFLGGDHSYSWDTRSFGDGLQELELRAWDQVNHVNTTSIVVHVDNTPPTLVASLPANGTLLHQVVHLTMVGLDANFKNMTLYVNGTALSTWTTGGAVGYDWNTALDSDGPWILSVKVWDLAGNLNTTARQVNLDNTPPTLTTTPASNVQYVRGNLTIRISCVDLYFKNVVLSIDGLTTGNWTTTNPTYKWNTTTYGEGAHTLVFSTWDTVGNLRQITWSPIVDNTPPLIAANIPSSGSYAHQTVVLSVSCTDANLQRVTLFIDGFNMTSSTSGDVYFNWYTTLYPNDISNITIICFDKAGNSNRTTSLVYVDNAPPILRISLTTIGQFVTGNPSLNIQCIDANFKNVTLLIDGIEIETWTIGNPVYHWNTTAYSDGSHTVGLVGWDLAGNENQTTLLTVYVDNTPPSIPSLTYPNQGESFNSTTLGFPLSWSASLDSGSGVDHYVLQLDTSPYFDSVNLRTILLSAANYTIPEDQGLSNGTWYWHVYAVDRVGNVGNFSIARSFQVVVRLVPTTEGLPLPLLVGLAGGIPALVILSSIVLMRRRRREEETEEYDRKSLMAAYVFSSDGRAMFTHAFKETRVEPQLLSGFLTAISEMMKEVIGGERRPLRTIERSDARILIEFGSVVTGALVTKKASREYRRRLKAFVARFEDDYADKIHDWDGDDSIFQAAPETIEEVFATEARVTTYPTVGGLDDLLVSEKLGGVAISVTGKTGSGKTEFCLRYAASLLKRWKPVIILAASLPPKEIREKLRENRVDLLHAEEQGTLIIYDAYSGVSGLQSEEKYKFGSPGELNNLNLALSRNLGKLKNATIIFDSLSSMVDYSELELVVDFIRTVKVKLQQGGHTVFFIIDSNAHDKNQLNYLLSVMDGEIETLAETTKKGELERLVSFKRLKGFKVKPGYHKLK